MNIEVTHDEGAGVSFYPWTDGHAVGFHVVDDIFGDEEYIYLNPSGHSDNAPDVFVYMGPTGDVQQDEPAHFYSVLDSVFRNEDGVLFAHVDEAE